MKQHAPERRTGIGGALLVGMLSSAAVLPLAKCRGSGEEASLYGKSVVGSTGVDRSAAKTTSVNCWLALRPVVSRATMVTVWTPGAVGVPTTSQPLVDSPGADVAIVVVYVSPVRRGSVNAVPPLLASNRKGAPTVAACAVMALATVMGSALVTGVVGDVGAPAVPSVAASPPPQATSRASAETAWTVR